MIYTKISSCQLVQLQRYLFFTFNNKKRLFVSSQIEKNMPQNAKYLSNYSLTHCSFKCLYYKHFHPSTLVKRPIYQG